MAKKGREGVAVETMAKLEELIEELSMGQLLTVSDRIHDAFVDSRNRKDFKASRQFRKHDLVEWGKGGQTFRGRVETVNQRTISVTESAEGIPWRISFVHARLVKEDSSDVAQSNR